MSPFLKTLVALAFLSSASIARAATRFETDNILYLANLGAGQLIVNGAPAANLRILFVEAQKINFKLENPCSKGNFCILDSRFVSFNSGGEENEACYSGTISLTVPGVWDDQVVEIIKRRNLEYLTAKAISANSGYGSIRLRGAIDLTKDGTLWLQRSHFSYPHPDPSPSVANCMQPNQFLD